MSRRLLTLLKLTVALILLACSATVLHLQFRSSSLRQVKLVAETKYATLGSHEETSAERRPIINSHAPPSVRVPSSIPSSANLLSATTLDTALYTNSTTRDDKLPLGQEIQQVLHNLDVCLSTANLTHYFIQNKWLSAARSNAEQFITTLRRNIPVVFNSSYRSACWKVDFDMNHCNRPACQMPATRGHLGSESYTVFNGVPGGVFSKVLTNMYPKGLTSTMVCMPKVFIAGFPKCGTTYLFCLIEGLYGNREYSLVKEPYFWVPRASFHSHQTPYEPSELIPYLLNFMPATESESRNRFSVAIDASPNLFFRWRQNSADGGLVNYCLAPAVLPQVLPDSKFIVILREPVDMLYSTFWFSCSDLGIKLTQQRMLGMPDEFHDKVLKKIKIFENCAKDSPVDKCTEDVSEKLYESCGRVRLEKGFYHLHIRKWLALFPREQFLFIIAEDLKAEKEIVGERILEFLGPNLHSGATQRVASRGSSFCGNVQKYYNYHSDPRLWMRNDTRQILTAFFKPYNRQLAILLQDNRFLWEGE